jgi:hypothetical protein
VLKHLGDAKIHDLKDRPAAPVVRDKQVARLEIAVDDARPVGLIEGVGELVEERPHHAPRHGAVLLEVLVQGLPFEELHRHKRDTEAIIDARVKHVNDVRALADAAGDLRLAHEHFHELRPRDEVRVHDLERARLAGARIPRLIHDGHAPLSQHRFDAVPRADYVADDDRHPSHGHFSSYTFGHPRTSRVSRILTPGGNASSSSKKDVREKRGARLALMRRFVRAAAGLFPLTPLGMLVLGGSAAGLFGLALPRKDLVLLVICAAGLGVTALSLGLSVFSAVGLFVALRRVRSGGATGASSLEVECGVKEATGFSVSSLWFVPLVRVRWSWSSPEASVETARRGRRLFEIVTPRRRGRSAWIKRRIEVGDAFQLARISFGSREDRGVRALPSKGSAKSLSFTHTLAEGGDLPYPADRAEGEASDFRRYSAGDPMRFILWKTFAKTRQLMVRSPEQAISPARRTIAYLVAGKGDEAAAGVARAAMESGSFGSSWVLGADGVPWVAEDRGRALELLAVSGECPADQGGAGLDGFLKSHGSSGGGLGARILLFVPPLAGPWLGRAAGVARAWAGGRRAGGGQIRRMAVPGGAGIEAIVCSDGIARRSSARWLARLLFMEAAEGGDNSTGGPSPTGDSNLSYLDTNTEGGGLPAPAPAAQVAAVLRALSAAGADVLLADRRSGKIFAGAQAKAILAAAEARAIETRSAVSGGPA